MTAEGSTFVFVEELKFVSSYVRQSFVIYNCQCTGLIEINNSQEEHDHARLRMSSITRPGLLGN